jgi:CheY-like chemotaxis protein
MAQHILIVEDDVMIQGFLTLTLEAVGYRISAVGSGTGMFSVLQHEQVDLVLLDLGLPDSDGLDLTKEIRKKHTIPIIVASARRKPEDREAALALGANHYITKPFEPSELIERVKFYLAGGDAGTVSPQKPDTFDQITPITTASPVQVPEPAPVINPSPAPKASISQPTGQPTSVDSASRETDKMVMLLGVLVLIAALGGGVYWYFDRMGGEGFFADQASEKNVSEKAKSETSPQAEVQGARRGALQPPQPDPVRIAEPPKQQVLAKKVTSAPATTPTPPPVQPRTAPANLTESVIARPQSKLTSSTTRAAVPNPVAVTPEKIECGEVPDVDWWRVKTHGQIASYVQRKHAGDWQPYVKSWVERLKKLQDIYRRGSAIKTGNGTILQDEDLAKYVNQIAKRVAVTRCLADQAMTR